MMRNSLVIRVLVFIFLTLLSNGIYADNISTCKDLRRKIELREDEIKSLNLTLKEYKLARDDKEDISDECNEYETCSDCLFHRGKIYIQNHSCGWCVLGNRCSLQENCQDGASNSNLWITGMERCPKIRAVMPPHMPVQGTGMLQIIMPLPEYDGMFICSFEVLGKTLLTKGKKTNTTEGGVTCIPPPTYEIPEIPKNNVQVPVKLSIRIPYGSNLASTTNFILYDCGRYDSCSWCASSPLPCAWCIAGNKCTHDVQENCRNDNIVFSKSVSRPTIREGPAFCPRVLPHPSTPSNEILIPSGSTKRIHVKVESLVIFQVQSRFLCQVKGARVTQVIGQLLAEDIYCDPMTFKVPSGKAIARYPFSLYWDGSYKLDNILDLQVVVYHCGLLANSCSECLDLPKKFDCGWCETGNSCTFRDNCDEPSWTEDEKKCTKPQITSIYPKSGLLTGRTNITITGVNFGKESSDTKFERIRLLKEDGSVITECVPLSYRTRKSTLYQIHCQLGIPDIEPGSNEFIKGFFELKIADRFGIVSDEEFTLVNPSLTQFEPVKGLKSGGTFLKIEGRNLDAGGEVKVLIGDLPCNVTSRNLMTIRCVTSPSPRTRSSEVRVIFDGEERTLSSYYFYVEDPYVRDVKSGNGVNDPIGTLSGGNLIIVDGDNFDHVPNPYIYIIVDGVQYPGSCIMESDQRMECFSPRLPSDVLNFCSREGHMEFDYGFRMGDVQDVQNISRNTNFGKFRIYPDPFVMPFTEKKMTKIYRSNYLTIQGRYLDTAFDERDVTVHIGDEECVVTSLSHTQLVCRPPASQPRARDGDGSKLPEVVVKILEKFEFFIGFLQYADKFGSL